MNLLGISVFVSGFPVISRLVLSFLMTTACYSVYNSTYQGAGDGAYPEGLTFRCETQCKRLVFMSRAEGLTLRCETQCKRVSCKLCTEGLTLKCETQRKRLVFMSRAEGLTLICETQRKRVSCSPRTDRLTLKFEMRNTAQVFSLHVARRMIDFEM
jgi:hypothetical protein